jgi:hypothetical protein
MEEERFLVLWFREEIRTNARDEGGKWTFAFSVVRLPAGHIRGPREAHPEVDRLYRAGFTIHNSPSKRSPSVQKK